MGKSPSLLEAIRYPFPACLISHCGVFSSGDLALLTRQSSKWPQNPVGQKKNLYFLDFSVVSIPALYLNGTKQMSSSYIF